MQLKKLFTLFVSLSLTVFILLVASCGDEETNDGWNTGTGTATGTGPYYPPTIKLLTPGSEGAYADSTFRIKWEFTAHPNTSPVVSLYYDDDNEKTGNETAIAETIRASTTLFDWKCDSLTEGKYYLLAVIDDGYNKSSYRSTNRIGKKRTNPVYVGKIGKEHNTDQSYSEGKLSITHNPPGKPIMIMAKHADYLFTCDISPNGKNALSAGSDTTVYYWDLSTGNILAELDGPDSMKTIFGVKFAPDGYHAISAGNDKKIRYYDLTNRIVKFEINDIDSPFRCVDISSDGQYCAFAGDNAIAYYYKIAYPPIMVKEFNGHTSWIKTIKISNDGRYLLTGGMDKTIKYWDISTGSLIRTLTGHNHDVYSVVFSPDGKYALSGGGDYNMIYWDLTTGARVTTFSGHTYDVFGVDISSDGSRALSASGDYSVCFWNINTNVRLLQMRGHELQVNSVCFSPDDMRALSVSSDKKAIYWQLW